MHGAVRAYPAGACTRRPAAIPSQPCDAARLAAHLPPPRRRASPPRRYRHSYSQLSSFAESVAVAGNAVATLCMLVPAKKDK